MGLKINFSYKIDPPKSVHEFLRNDFKNPKKNLKPPKNPKNNPKNPPKLQKMRKDALKSFFSEL